MMLQAVRFLRHKPIVVNLKSSVKWELGFACVKCFGVADIHWIIDKNGEKLAKIYDYHFIQPYPGSMAEIPDNMQ
jgi:hypothetical protein